MNNKLFYPIRLIHTEIHTLVQGVQ